MTKRYLALVIVLLFIGMTATDVSAKKKGRTGMSDGKSEKELAQLAVDIAEIQNLMSLHSWYHGASMNDVEIEEIWSQRDDIVWGQNSGYWVGRDAIMDYYGQTVDRESTKGIFVAHTITTPVIEVAKDRKTAQGIWYTPGIVGGFDVGFSWMFEKYGVDFVYEDGAWKVWHMIVLTDAGWSLDGTISADGVGGPAAASSGETIGAEASGSSPGGSGVPTEQVKLYTEVSPDLEQRLFPAVPMPYNTWEDTTGYYDAEL